MRTNKVLAILSCLLFSAFFAKWAGLFGFYFAASDTPPNGLGQGQKFLTVGCCYSVTEGDLVVFTDGKRDYVRQVLEILEDGRVRVQQTEVGVMIINEKYITGKVVLRF